jgi:hypothetical protein
MKTNDRFSAEEKTRLEEFSKRYREALKKRPEVSDEEFMAETEVSDEQYAMGLVLPGIAGEDE